MQRSVEGERPRHWRSTPRNRRVSGWRGIKHGFGTIDSVGSVFRIGWVVDIVRIVCRRSASSGGNMLLTSVSKAPSVCMSAGRQACQVALTS